MHADRTAVTVQSNKIVSNDVKDNEVLRGPSYGKNQTNFLANPILGKHAKCLNCKLGFQENSGPLGEIVQLSREEGGHSPRRRQ